MCSLIRRSNLPPNTGADALLRKRSARDHRGRASSRPGPPRPCSKGLPVADVLRYLTYADGYGQFALGRENFQRMSLEQQQVRCGDCTECAVKCPNGVRVAQQLIRAQELFA